jgi:hypothetical protein
MKPRTLLAILTTVATLQLALLWVQGAQLYRQQETLQALRLDVQELAEIIDQGNAQGTDPGSWTPSRNRGAHRRGFRATALQDEEAERTRKELDASRESAQKATRDAAEAQKKLSISEAARRADEKAKVEAAKDEWVRWVWGALGVIALAIFLRAWLRRR